MTRLRMLQETFQNYLTHNNPDMLQYVSPDPLFSAENRLNVYFDAYRLRLLDILQLDFEKTHTLMGDEAFEQAFHLYLEAHPSHHFSVRYFGQHFPHFLKVTPSFSDFPMLSEMAYFEWYISYTLDAKDAPVIRRDDLLHLTPEEWSSLQFEFHPSVISHVFEWNTPALWQLIDKNEPPQPPQKQPQPFRCIFWRKGVQSFYQSCQPYEEKIFESIHAKQNFTEICESLLPILPEEEIPLKAAQTLHHWLEEERFQSAST